MIYQNSLGIDFREDRLYLVYLQASFTGVRFRASVSYPLNPEDPRKDNVVRAAELINGFILEKRISNAVIHLGIPRRYAIVRHIELPSAARENLENTLRYEMEKYIPLPVNDIHFSGQIIAEDKERNKIDVFLAAVKKKDMERFIGLATRIQEGMSGIEISSTAIVNYLHHAGELGEERIDVPVFRDGEGLEINVIREGRLLFSRYLDIGKDREVGEDAFMEAFTAIQKLKAVEGNALRLLSMNHEKTDVLVDRVCAVDSRIETARIDIEQKQIPSPEFIPAYGLALRGLMNAPMKINLLPQDLRKRPDRAAFYALIVLVCAVMIGFLAWGGSQMVTKRNYLNQLNREIVQLEAEVRRIGHLTEQAGHIEHRIEFLQGRIHDQMVVVDVLKLLTEKIPENAWINSLHVVDRDVQIDGQADSASELVSILEKTGKFRDVAFLSPITKDRDGKERFRIGFKVR